jgi:hypothetical protein
MGYVEYACPISGVKVFDGGLAGGSDPLELCFYLTAARYPGMLAPALASRGKGLEQLPCCPCWCGGGEPKGTDDSVGGFPGFGCLCLMVYIGTKGMRPGCVLGRMETSSTALCVHSPWTLRPFLLDQPGLAVALFRWTSQPTVVDSLSDISNCGRCSCPAVASGVGQVPGVPGQPLQWRLHPQAAVTEVHARTGASQVQIQIRVVAFLSRCRPLPFFSLRPPRKQLLSCPLSTSPQGCPAVPCHH